MMDTSADETDATTTTVATEDEDGDSKKKASLRMASNLESRLRRSVATVLSEMVWDVATGRKVNSSTSLQRPFWLIPIALLLFRRSVRLIDARPFSSWLTW